MKCFIIKKIKEIRGFVMDFIVNKNLLLIEILVMLEHEIECLSKLIEPLEDQNQKFYELKDKILKLKYAIDLDII